MMTVVLALLHITVILEEEEEVVVVVKFAEAVVPVGDREVEEMFHIAAGGKVLGDGDRDRGRDGDNDAEPGPSGVWHASELTEAQETLPAAEKEMSHNQHFCSHTAPNTRTYGSDPLLTVVNLYVLPYMNKQKGEPGYQIVLHIRN
jgi:hypothetical protein